MYGHKREQPQSRRQLLIPSPLKPSKNFTGIPDDGANAKNTPQVFQDFVLEHQWDVLVTSPATMKMPTRVKITSFSKM